MKEFLINLLVSICCGAIVIPCFLICLKLSEWYKDGIEARVQSRIGWWLIYDGDQVLDEMQKSCDRLDIDKKYLLASASEIEMASKIIENFQEKKKYLYFNIDATIKNAKTPYHYFLMYHLSSFLDDKNDICFDGNKMYIEISRERHDIAASSYCAATSYYTINYSLTEYGMVYNKLRYMAKFYCEQMRNKINKTNFHHYSEGVKKILDTQENIFYEDIK